MTSEMPRLTWTCPGQFVVAVFSSLHFPPPRVTIARLAVELFHVALVPKGQSAPAKHKTNN
jgi:hypothetical protein